MDIFISKIIFLYLQLMDSSRNWWKCRNISKEIGYVPCTLLKKIVYEEVMRILQIRQYYITLKLNLMIIRNGKYHTFLALQATMSINGDSPSQSRNSGSHRNGNWKNSGHNSSMKSTRSNNQTNLQKDYAMRQKSRESRRGNILRS